MQCPCAVWSSILKSADSLDSFDRAIGEMRSLVGLFLPLFYVVVMETSNGLMPTAGELMMRSRLFIVPGVEHAVQIIWVNLCSLVLRPRGSMML